MKKCLSIMLVLMLITTLLVSAATADGQKLSIVTTIFPIYDWVREIVGDENDIDVTLLLDKGVDLHSYQPTAQDIMKVATADVFIYVGGESDEWVEDALAEAVNPNMKVINLLDALGDTVKEEEVVEGMEAEEEEHEEGEEEAEYDEHVWLSLRNARILVQTIADQLAEADPDHGASYQTNAVAYMEKLAVLDAGYTDMFSQAEFKTVLFGDRFPFRYLVDDYGLNYYAAFVGCSAETEASFETIVFLARKMDELNLPAVLTIEGGNHRIAETIINTTAGRNQKILTVDSLQGKPTDGETYLSVMEENLAVFHEALNR